MATSSGRRQSNTAASTPPIPRDETPASNSASCEPWYRKMSSRACSEGSRGAGGTGTDDGAVVDDVCIRRFYICIAADRVCAVTPPDSVEQKQEFRRIMRSVVLPRRGVLLLALCVLAPACGDEQAAVVPDLGAIVPDLSTDLSIGDLAVAHDLTWIFDLAHCVPLTPVDGFASSADAAGFCDGTTLAGTCAQAFFARFASCYVPAGCREYHRTNNTIASWSFASGAYTFWDLSGIRAFSQSGHSCASSDSTGLSQDDRWTLNDGTKLTINWTSGNVTCPDGSQIQISNPKSCDALNTLVTVPMAGSDPGCCLP